MSWIGRKKSRAASTSLWWAGIRRRVHDLAISGDRGGGQNGGKSEENRGKTSKIEENVGKIEENREKSKKVKENRGKREENVGKIDEKVTKIE